VPASVTPATVDIFLIPQRRTVQPAMILIAEYARQIPRAAHPARLAIFLPKPLLHSVFNATQIANSARSLLQHAISDSAALPTVSVAQHKLASHVVQAV